MPVDLDTIKVVIRFKGKESLEDEEKDAWKFNEKATEVRLPTAYENSKGEKLTFDHVLVENT
jgi:hypothetical protein